MPIPSGPHRACAQLRWHHSHAATAGLCYTPSTCQPTNHLHLISPYHCKSAIQRCVRSPHSPLHPTPCRLAMDPMAVAGIMCTAVFEGDLVKLRRLLHSGAPPDACDYDRRCALHIAGAEGNLAAVKLLVEEGHADAGFQVGQGRWRRGTRTRASRWGRLLPFVQVATCPRPFALHRCCGSLVHHFRPLLSFPDRTAGATRRWTRRGVWGRHPWWHTWRGCCSRGRSGRRRAASSASRWGRGRCGP